jgi:hypothetical protein
LPPDQLKEIKEEDILTVIRSYYDISGDTMGKEKFLCMAQLDLFVAFLHSPFLSNKLTALIEIK